MEKLAIVLIVFVLLGSMPTPCDGIAAGEWVLNRQGKRDYKDLSDGYNEVTRGNYRTFKEKYEATDDNYKANWRKECRLRWRLKVNRTFGEGLWWTLSTKRQASKGLIDRLNFTKLILLWPAMYALSTKLGN